LATCSLIAEGAGHGRGEHSDVVIPDPHVSRQHVALLHDGTRCFSPTGELVDNHLGIRYLP
jgi:hypothetical protein